ncbi:MAG TPA: hypothetical protein VOA78_15315 [Candidatus Dormibacteraeota bacterium]|nr:hypothetical protein [Candidatus Dormibacteraeota bacterium]
MAPGNVSRTPSTRDIAERGEAIYKNRYQADFESKFHDKFVAVNVRNEDATIADTSEEAIRLALEKDPDGLFHLMRVGHQAAFEAGWYMSCAS